jgi:hypothetical protein
MATAAEWTYEDWITYPEGSATRLSRLALHIGEVANAIRNGSYQTQGKNHSKSELSQYLQDLMKRESSEASIAGAAAGTRSSFTRGVVIGPRGVGRS